MEKQEKLEAIHSGVQAALNSFKGLHLNDLVYAENLLEDALEILEEMKDEQKREIGQNLF